MAAPCAIRLYTVRIDVECGKQSQLATYLVDGKSGRVYFSMRETVSPNNLTHLHNIHQPQPSRSRPTTPTLTPLLPSYPPSPPARCTSLDTFRSPSALFFSSFKTCLAVSITYHNISLSRSTSPTSRATISHDDVSIGVSSLLLLLLV